MEQIDTDGEEESEKEVWGPSDGWRTCQTAGNRKEEKLNTRAELKSLSS